MTLKLSNEQKRIVEAKEDKIVVFSSPASGKTACMTERVRWLLKNGTPPEKMAVITFTNLAASELRERLGEDYKEGLFVGTVHSLANTRLNQSGYNTSQVRDEEDFDRLFEMIKADPDCMKGIDYVLLDEAQDSDKSQLEFIFDIINPSKFFLVGDFRQVIYDFRDNAADVDYFRELMSKKDVKTYHLTQNYRNGENILDYSNWILSTMIAKFPKNIVPMSKIKGKIHNTSFDELVMDIKYFKQVGKYNYKDWFILCRGNAQVAETIDALIDEGISNDTFKQKGMVAEDLQKIMDRESVKVLTIHSAKGLEAPNVAVIGNNMRDESEKRVSYVACTRAKENLYWIKPKRRGRYY